MSLARMLMHLLTNSLSGFEPLLGEIELHAVMLIPSSSAQIVIILRGLPGAGKSHIAKLIRVSPLPS